jgi:phospholipid-binding lipoprotein MlaA
MKRYPLQWLVLLHFAFLPVFVYAGEFTPEYEKAVSPEGPFNVQEAAPFPEEGISTAAADSAPEQNTLTVADEAVPAAIEPDLDKETENGEIEEEKGIADPFESLNRAMFNLNDKLYFWVAKPAAKAYSFFVPEWGRIRVRNVFKNVAAPIRIVNSLLQFKFHAAAKEVGRFLVNTTAGIGGMFDVLKDNPDAQPSEEDLGQTLGFYGLGNGFYVVWPVLGPSSFRDSIGLAGDYFLDPVSYITPAVDSTAIRSVDRVNDTSLRIGEYEDLKDAAIDPYVSFRDAYIQYRNKKVKD